MKTEAKKAAVSPLYETEIIAASGNVRPYQALVRCDGRYIGHTGHCKTEQAARDAAQRVVEQNERRLRFAAVEGK